MQAENRNLLIGIIFGMAIGAAASVLLSPKESSVESGRLAEKSEQAKEKVTDVATKGRGYVETTKSKLREALDAGVEAAREKRAELEAEVGAEIQQAAVMK